MSDTTVIDCGRCPVGRRDADAGAGSGGSACDDCVVGLLLAIPPAPRRLQAAARQDGEIGCIEFRRLNCQ